MFNFLLPWEPRHGVLAVDVFLLFQLCSGSIRLTNAENDSCFLVLLGFCCFSFSQSPLSYCRGLGHWKEPAGTQVREKPILASCIPAPSVAGAGAAGARSSVLQVWHHLLLPWAGTEVPVGHGEQCHPNKQHRLIPGVPQRPAEERMDVEAFSAPLQRGCRWGAQRTCFPWNMGTKELCWFTFVGFLPPRLFIFVTLVSNAFACCIKMCSSWEGDVGNPIVFSVIVQDLELPWWWKGPEWIFPAGSSCEALLGCRTAGNSVNIFSGLVIPVSELI